GGERSKGERPADRSRTTPPILSSQGRRPEPAHRRTFQRIRQWRHPMKNDRTIDSLRRRLTEIENDLVDELAAGRIGRREFMRQGPVLGVALPLLAGLAGGFGLPLLS